MNKKAFKALIISKCGEIIYSFYYFVKDSKRWIYRLKKPYMKSAYESDVIECSKYGIISEKYYEKENRNIEGYLDLFAF